MNCQIVYIINATTLTGSPIIILIYPISKKIIMMSATDRNNKATMTFESFFNRGLDTENHDVISKVTRKLEEIGSIAW